MAAPVKFLTPTEYELAASKHRAATLGESDAKALARFVAKRNDTTTVAPLDSKDMTYYTQPCADLVIRSLKECGWTAEAKPYIHHHDKKCNAEKKCERYIGSSGVYGDESVPFWVLSPPRPFVAPVETPIVERPAPPTVEGNGGPSDTTDAKSPA